MSVGLPIWSFGIPYMKNINTITTKISAWGNGYGIRLPKSFVKQIAISPDNALEVCVKADSSILIKPKTKRKVLSKEYFRKALKNMKRISPEDMHELDWGKPVGKEVW